MSTYTSPLEGQLLDDLTEEVIGITGLEIPKAEVQKLFTAQEPLLGEIRQWGFCDTLISERISDVVANDLVGRDWPEYRKGHPVFDSFRKKFFTEAKHRGWLQPIPA